MSNFPVEFATGITVVTQSNFLWFTLWFCRHSGRTAPNGRMTDELERNWKEVAMA
jgi:hypothetical protein